MSVDEGKAEKGSDPKDAFLRAEEVNWLKLRNKIN